MTKSGDEERAEVSCGVQYAEQARCAKVCCVQSHGAEEHEENGDDEVEEVIARATG